MPDSLAIAIRHVLTYFSLFAYPPTAEEVHRFLTVQIPIDTVVKKLRKITAYRSFSFSQSVEERFANTGDELFFERYAGRRKTALAKIKRTQLYFSLLQRFSVIDYIGISGSLALLNGRSKDDIDVFIVTREGGLWTGRLIAIVLALLLGKKRKRRVKHANDKVCLNLFFSRDDLHIPPHKQNDYIAHEILQLQTVYDKGGVYDELLIRNAWIQQLFPNTSLPDDRPGRMHRASKEPFEALAKAIQLPLVRRHTTKEYITDTQLWFFPRDYEKVVREKITLREYR